MPSKPDCPWSGNEDCKLSHLGRELDESSIGGLTGLATEECGDALGDVSFESRLDCA
jgi:hypothetical protein